MSLIHDALKSMDATAQQASAPAVAAQVPAPTGNSSAARGGQPAWVGGALTFAVVVGVGCAGLTYWQSQKSPKGATLSPAAIAVVQPEVEQASAPALPAELAQSLNVEVADVSANARMAQVATTTESVSVSHALAVTVPAPAQGMKVMEQSTLTVPVTRRVVQTARPVVVTPPWSERQVADPVRATDVSATAPATDESPIELRFARFVIAMKGGHKADAQHELNALKTRLPAGSLGLMRAQAWFDLRAGNDDAAAEQYHAILERMAGDEEAAINLASILVGQGKPEDARATLASAVRLQPDSDNLRSALAQFTPNARQ